MAKSNIQRCTVGYLGPRGTFCEQAASKHFGEKNPLLVPYPSIKEIFTAVTSNTVDYGVVPVENSLDGSVDMTLDLLLTSDLSICGEVNLRVIHNLIVNKTTQMNQINLILSHAKALAQCQRFIEKELPRVELRSVSSTARAVELISGIETAAAIGSDVAAEAFGMEILRRRIEDNPNNFTRFFVLGFKDAPPTGRDKTSILFSTKHVPGSLHSCLEPFAQRNINLTKIESRPMRGTPWEYIFYLDLEGHKTETKIQEALNGLKERSTFIKILGSYPKKT